MCQEERVFCVDETREIEIKFNKYMLNIYCLFFQFEINPINQRGGLGCGG